MLGCLVVIGLVLVVAVIVLLVFVVNANGDSGDSSDAGDQAQTQDAAGTEAGPDEDALANPVQCRTEALDVAIDLEAPTFSAGDPVQVPVIVTNTGDVPCLTDTGHESMTVEVSSGQDLIWSSAQCAPGSAERDLLLDIGASQTHTVTWDGTRGATSCDSESTATSGTYRLDVALMADGADAGAEQAFTLD